jgi:hypothetical protein
MKPRLVGRRKEFKPRLFHEARGSLMKGCFIYYGFCFTTIIPKSRAYEGNFVESDELGQTLKTWHVSTNGPVKVSDIIHGMEGVIGWVTYDDKGIWYDQYEFNALPGARLFIKTSEEEHQRQINKFDVFNMFRRGDRYAKSITIFDYYFTEDDAEYFTRHKTKGIIIKGNLVFTSSIVGVGGEDVDYHIGNEFAKAEGPNLLVKKNSRFITRKKVEDTSHYTIYIDIYPTNDKLRQIALDKIKKKLEVILQKEESVVRQKYRMDLNDPQVERINRRKMWKEINIAKLKLLSEVYNRMS